MATNEEIRVHVKMLAKGFHNEEDEAAQRRSAEAAIQLLGIALTTLNDIAESLRKLADKK